jgi:hypothetical protein
VHTLEVIQDQTAPTGAAVLVHLLMGQTGVQQQEAQVVMEEEAAEVPVMVLLLVVAVLLMVNL